jgi:hypothetical protein
VSNSEWLDRFETALRFHADAPDKDDDRTRTDAQIALAHVAGEEVSVPEGELRGAVRRALLLLAVGGDPSRGLDMHGRAVEAIADELDSPFRREILSDGLEGLRIEAAERSALVEVVEMLQRDGELAWRAFSAGRLVNALEQDELADG